MPGVYGLNPRSPFTPCQMEDRAAHRESIENGARDAPLLVREQKAACLSAEKSRDRNLDFDCTRSFREGRAKWRMIRIWALGTH